MNEFTIRCTEEQTLKALSLGADIKATFSDIPNKFEYEGCHIEIPTAEEMVGWLETQDDIEEITIQRNRAFRSWAYLVTNKRNKLVACKSIYQSRPEATLAAIDAALEYLNNNKKDNER